VIRIATLIATWFGLGFAPFAPGTFGSLGALLPAMALWHFAGWSQLWIAGLGVWIIPPAVWAAGVVAESRQRKDPGLVVVDEVSGQWITIAGITVFNWKSWLLAFLLFRIFDIWKPWPARQLEGLPGGFGIVADDVMAGVYAALVLYGLGWLNLY